MRVCKSCKLKLVMYELAKDDQTPYEKFDPCSDFKVNSKKSDKNVIVGEPNLTVLRT